MTNKERYSEWAQAQEFIPLFMMPWWLDAVCAGKEWDVLLAEDNEGHIVGAMPYMLSKNYGSSTSLCRLILPSEVSG